MVGLSGLEPLTSRLSGVRSNQLSYRPVFNSIFELRLRKDHFHDPSKLSSECFLCADVDLGLSHYISNVHSP
jgi:hypothetical protein